MMDFYYLFSKIGEEPRIIKTAENTLCSVLGLNNFTEVFIFNFQVFLSNGPPRKKVNHLRDQSIPTYHILLMEVPDPRQGFGENL